MPKKSFINIFRRRRKTAGFTLLELLVSVAIGWIVISGLIYLVVQMMQTDRKEFSLTQTQAEMQNALDYIATELQEAVYVYEGECLTTGRGTFGAPTFCQGLTKNITFPANVTPVLAFWKLEQLPYSAKADDQFPSGTCATGTAGDTCRTVNLIRNSPTLVIYAVRTDNPSGQTWKGPARVTRYQLRQYAKLSNMQETTNFEDPLQIGYGAWPCTSATTCPAQQAYAEDDPNKNADILVDLVDRAPTPTSFQDFNSTAAGVQPCPAGYSATPPDIVTPAGGTNENTSSLNSSFYACVNPYTLGQGQDVMVILRGNAIDRAGLQGRNTTYLPQVQARVQTRATFNRQPPPISTK